MKHPFHGLIFSIVVAILASMLVTYLALAHARKIRSWIGPKGADAATRIVNFFVASMGMGLVFLGVVQALQQYGIVHMQ